MQDINQAAAYVAAIGATDQIIDWRAIHDKDKAIPAIPFRDTLAGAWSSICHYNNQGYGIFAVVAQLDGVGRHLVNVTGIRAHYVDLDNLSAQQNYERASQWTPAPSFAVNSSPGKYHVYWPVAPYSGNDYFTLIQRKLRQFFDGDGKVIDATRVMRLPGTIHSKGEPHLVTCHALPGYGAVNAVTTLEAALQHVNVIDGGNGGRHELGDPDLAAPSLDWIRYALKHTDPNNLDRGDWISFSAAIKQAGWSVTDPDTLYQEWLAWCARYENNDVGENFKQWDSIRTTEVGWPAIMRKVPSIAANLRLGAGGNRPKHAIPGMTPVNDAGDTPTPAGEPATPPMPEDIPRPPADDLTGEILTDQEQAIWFAGCVLVERMGEILTPKGRYQNSTKFNASYGGKQFIISNTGKVTNEPWQAATRGSLFMVPKVDHVRFLPEEPEGAIIMDQLGRKGVNTYKPIMSDATPGDVTPFLRHMQFLLPNDADREMFIRYMAHNVKFPGFKIPWAPMLQSAEGAGKSFIQLAMEFALGQMYCYTPKAPELVKSGSTFNAWMRSKLMIIVNEIKVDERRELIEILKPMISDARVEVQSKGIDQELEDNCANWIFFSNYKDAIPINKASRRYAIYYSAIQSPEDAIVRGMDHNYFITLFDWLRSGGHRFVTHWLKNHPVERGGIPMRAPDTSSTNEALRQSVGPLEMAIMNAIDDGVQGFRGGWVSVTAALMLAKAQTGRSVSPKTITTILEGLRYHDCGRSTRSFLQEDSKGRSQLYAVVSGANVADYGRAQGYE